MTDSREARNHASELKFVVDRATGIAIRSWARTNLEPDPHGKFAARTTQFTYGPILRYFRHRNIDKKYDHEPAWRNPTPRLETGYQPRHYGPATALKED